MLNNNHIESQIKNARPQLKDVAPFVHKVIWSFVWFNAWLAVSFFLQSSVSLKLVPIVNDIFNQAFWGGVFSFIGLGLAYGLIRNNFAVIKRFMIFGVLIKAMWFYALIALGAAYGFKTQLGVIGLWFFAAWIQALAVIYFLPKGVSGARNIFK